MNQLSEQRHRSIQILKASLKEMQKEGISPAVTAGMMMEISIIIAHQIGGIKGARMLLQDATRHVDYLAEKTPCPAGRENSLN